MHQDRQGIPHRIESVAFGAQDVLHMLWMDKRDQLSKASTQECAGAMIYRKGSSGGGQTFGLNTKVGDQLCECCRSDLACNPQAMFLPAWLHPPTASPMARTTTGRFAAFAVLHKAVQQRKDKPERQVELNAVMMDVAGPQALRHASHFKGMTQMYAFDGFEPAIRQAVDPAWPNVTPYVVLVDAKGQTQRVIGPPAPELLKRWLAPT